MNEGIDHFAKEQGLEKSTVFNLRLVLEELIVNVIHYAYENSEDEHPISVDLAMTKYGEGVSVKIEDRGVSFNPVDEISPNGVAAIPSPDGGFGIFLVSQKTRDLRYERIDEEINRLQFWMDAGKKPQS